MTPTRSLLSQQNRLNEAEQCARRGYEIFTTLGDSDNLFKSCSLLGQITQKNGRAEESREWRLKAENVLSIVQSKNEWTWYDERVAQQWAGLIKDVIATCRGDTQAKLRLEPNLQQGENSVDWRNQVSVIRRIIAGERGPQLLDGLDRMDTAIVKKILNGLSNG